ncbi:transposase [Streptomyces sp. NRRL B-1677]|nr:transposase [Streptomyces sp. NRRL B-1677]
MSKRPWIVDDELWAVVEPLLPAWPERAPGPRPVSDRLCLQGITHNPSRLLRSCVALSPTGHPAPTD